MKIIERVLCNFKILKVMIQYLYVIQLKMMNQMQFCQQLELFFYLQFFQLRCLRLDFNSKLKKCQKQQKKQQRIHITNVTLSYQCYSKNLRQIDRVIVKGSIEPMNIYTVDLNVDSLIRKVHKKKTVVDFSKKQKQKQTHLTESEQSKLKKKQKVLRRMKRDRLKQAVLKSQVAISETRVKDNNIKQSRVLFNKEFYHKWEQGFSCYLSGNWDQAQLIFKETLNFLPNYKDFLSKTLLRVIKEEQYLRNNWKGYNAHKKILQTDFFFFIVRTIPFMNQTDFIEYIFIYFLNVISQGVKKKKICQIVL